MFDTIAGLPIHPLVVHAAVVLGPLAALLLVIYVIKADWRMALRWPTVLTGVGAGLSAAVAASSGESLQHRVDQLASAAQRSLVEEHAEAGDMAAASLYVLAIAVVLVVFFLLRPRPAKPIGRGVAALGVLVTVVAVGFSTFAIVNAGHTGASASWEDVVATTTGGGE
ncbi:MAG: hypothetical protein KDB63_20985 [Nocardioidaceae bacterium]|nr:hypothetical protein [Nocardioidaceae bacterium]